MIERLIELVNTKMVGEGKFTAMENDRNILVEKTTDCAIMRVILNRKTNEVTIEQRAIFQMAEA